MIVLVLFSSANSSKFYSGCKVLLRYAIQNTTCDFLLGLLMAISLFVQCITLFTMKRKKRPAVTVVKKSFPVTYCYLSN